MFLPSLMTSVSAYKGESIAHAARFGQWQGDESRWQPVLIEYFISAWRQLLSKS
jgi:hypothetical protein